MLLRILVSNNSDLLRHLNASPFRRMSVEVVVVEAGGEIADAVQRSHPRLAILDAQMPGSSGYEAVGVIRGLEADCRVILVMGARINAAQMRQVAEAGCDEILIAPMSADELYDAVAEQLGLPRRVADRYSVDLTVIGDDGDRQIDGRVTNLSVDGARIIIPEPLGSGTSLTLSISLDDALDQEPIRVNAKVVWAQSLEHETVAGAAFQNVDAETRARLTRLIKWEIIDDVDRPRVYIKGDIVESTSFDDLLPALSGSVDFDMSQVRYINSMGVMRWLNFLSALDGKDYRFYACSTAFVLQAGLSQSMTGTGEIASFFAPYYCKSCAFEEDRLLQTEYIVAQDLQPPNFECPSCEDGEMELDELPERYLAFCEGR